MALTINEKASSAESAEVKYETSVVQTNSEAVKVNDQNNTVVVSASGTFGLPGPKGDKGDTGQQGRQGDKGDPGETGKVGPQGRGVVSMQDTDVDGVATVTYSDGSTENVPIPRGAKVDIFYPDTTAAKGTYKDYVWTKPAGAKLIEVFAISPGGGGASGRVGAAGTVRCGGGGGAAGTNTMFRLPADRITTSTLSVRVARGGAGAPAQTTADSDGNYPNNPAQQFVKSGNVTLGSYNTGQPGRGGTATSGSGGAGGWSMGNLLGPTSAAYPAGGAASTTGGVGGNGGACSNYGITSTGGGAGGGITTGNVFSNGGRGGEINHGHAVDGTNLNPGSTAGTTDGAVGGSGKESWYYFGTGGAGGSSSVTGNGGKGGNGGGYGSGGGGGGAAANGFSSGAGGDGGDGIIIITTYF